MSIDLKTATEAPLVDGDKIWGSDSAETAVKVATDVVGKAATQTLTNKTLTAPVISSITNVGTLTLPTSTDTLVGRDTTDTLTNKTLSEPVVTNGLLIQEMSADPANPAEGRAVVWQSDGTGTGNDGDIYAKITAGAVTKTFFLTDGDYEHPMGGVYISSPALTAVTGAGTWDKIAGTTTDTVMSTNMTSDSTDNRIKYTGTKARHFHVVAQATLTPSAGSNQDIGISVWHYDASGAASSIIASSEARTTISSTNKEQITTHCDVMLDTNDYIEMRVENASSGNDITAEKLYFFTIGMRM